MRGVFLAIQDRFQGKVYPTKEIDLTVEEGIISSKLHKTLKRYPEVKIGSYPCFDNSEGCVKLVLEHENDLYLEEAFGYLMGQVGCYKQKG